ncbi:type II secretion system minor pseudopilin GspH [Ectothiorhodospiraceae bacterium 2226]|nr:type II secretion system minor pseudopilin GspH [Ectothiorhodospiraceae bacterium 2226]
MRGARGFTLLELLVVLVVIGVLVSMAALSVRGVGAERHLAEEGRRFEALLGLAAQEAVLNTLELGIAVEAAGYRFMVLEEGDWREVNDPPLARRALPDGMEAELRLDGQPARPVEDAPQVVLYSSGEATPFELHLWVPGAGQRYVLRTGVTGRVAEAGLREDAAAAW